MRSSELEAHFPNLQATGYTVTSPKARVPNCVGWALGEENHYWDPGMVGVKGYYWHPSVPREDSLSAWTQLFEIHGYRVSESADFVLGVEKVAIYVGRDG